MKTENSPGGVIVRLPAKYTRTLYIYTLYRSIVRGGERGKTG